MKGVHLDAGRLGRRGIPEAVYAPGKSDDHLLRAFRESRNSFNLAIATRVDNDQGRLLTSAVPTAVHDRGARMVWAGVPLPSTGHHVAVFTAGTADLMVAQEVVVALRLFGITPKLVPDVGVAGLSRLLDSLPSKEPLLYVCCAGMDGALPAVLAGLVPRPVLAVPTSVGYGVAEGGKTALFSMLASCAEGVAVMNIDNGYGAAAFAALLAT